MEKHQEQTLAKKNKNEEKKRNVLVIDDVHQVIGFFVEEKKDG